MENRSPFTARTDAARRADGTEPAGEVTEFESDVVDLLVEMLRRALTHEFRHLGTEDLLSSLVMGDSAAGAAIAPGMRRAGGLSGLIAGRAGRGWVSDDNGDGGHGDGGHGDGGDGTAAVSGDGTAAVSGDEHEVEHEVDAAWRLARWQVAQRSGKGVAPSDREWPEPSGALRACLLHAHRLARGDASPGVCSRHVARALLDLPGTRAREACVLRRLDPAAAYTELDTLDTRARNGTEPPETGRPLSPAVTVLRRAGVLEDRSNWLARTLMAWTTGSADDGSPILFAVNVEAGRQAVRCGRETVEPVDLLLAVLALDRSLSLAGRSLPEALAPVNEAAALLRTHGVRPAPLFLAALAADPLTASAHVPRSAAAERAIAVARLTGAEHRASSVGTVHLVTALLDDAEGPVPAQLRALGVDLTALRTELGLRLSA
ncbi:Clp protease N-terminal domain-containing protein [Streptomyces sp. NPDC002018]|uniref:Clp protease N-terminal domain-containing protein n=1 Tax=Streptomyces sp. NPDC002018 TaxID=3364629 RepID=UPI0036BFD8B6